MKSLRKSLICLLLIFLNSGVYAFAESTNDENLKSQLYNHMKNWDTNFIFIYDGKSALDILKEAADEDDYLERSIAVYKSERYNNLFRVKIEYRTTKEQEEIVDAQLKKVADKLINENMSTLDKVITVNNYLVQLYKYDYSLKSDNVYSAMKTGETICQGYSMTAYKLFKILGIDCRIINGNRGTVSHSWNLVKIDNNWYQLDITNNDSVIRNKYLLKSDQYMIDNGFEWDRNKYPKAEKNYYETSTEYIDYDNDNETNIEKYYDESAFAK